METVRAWLANPAFLVLAAVLAGIAAKSLRRVGQRQRMIVERLGRFHRILGPGLQPVIPFVERCIVLDPATLLPGWSPEVGAQLDDALVKRFYASAAPGLPAANATDEYTDAEHAEAARRAREAVEQALLKGRDRR